MAGRLIWCRACGSGLPLEVGIRKPVVCPACNNNQRASWDDLPPFRVSENDRRFLRTLRIKVDDDETNTLRDTPRLPDKSGS